jgi:uncharacterized alpha-E superfamily protein
MLSRVANALFWLARYLERADASARFLAVTHSYAQELRSVSRAASDRCWIAARELLRMEDGGAGAEAAATFWRLGLDRELAASVLTSVSRARENARGIRDAIPSEMWEELNVLFLRFQEEAAAPPSENRELSLLRETQNVSHLLLGVRDNLMVRGDEWHFLRLGQFLERADVSIRLLDGLSSHPALREAAEAGRSIDTLHLAAALRSFAGFEAFSRAGYHLTPEGVFGFLLLDGRFPRSIEGAIQEAGYSLHALSGTPHDIFSNDAEQICGRTLGELRFAAIKEIMAQDFRAYLGRLLGRVDRLGNAVVELYFP